jgi:uncharacterized membrane protein
MSNFFKRFNDELQSAVVDGLITADQAKRLTEHAERKKTATKARGVVAFGVISGLLIAAGLCLIISHNWDKIPAFIKLSVFLLLLAATGEGARRATTNVTGVPLDALWFFLPLLGIGLWAQVFNLSGDPVKPYLVWMALAFPIALGSPRPVARILHVLGLFVVLFWGNFGSRNLISLQTHAWYGQGAIAVSWHAWTLTALVVAAIAWQAPRLSPRLFVFSTGGLLVWLLALLINPTPFRVRYEPVIILSLVSAAVLWVAASSRLDVPDTARKLPRIAWFAAVYGMTFLWHSRSFSTQDIGIPGLVLVSTMTIAAVSLSVLMPPHAFGKDLFWRRLGQIFLLLPVVLVGLTFANNVLWTKAAGLMANVIYIVATISLMIHGVKVGENAQIDQGLFAFLILILTRFIDVFGSFVTSGFAFIVAGILMAAMAWALQKSRSALRQLAAENRSS